MKNCKLFLWLLLVAIGFGAQEATAARKKKVKKQEPTETTLQLIKKVNDYWQRTRKPQVWAFWDQAAYYTGNMEAYKLTGEPAYLDYAEKWCRHNRWTGATSNDKRKWRYKTYGEGMDFVLFGDWQICFQTYIDMYHLSPAEYKVARAKEVMSYECHMPDNKFWWWSDALYMVMPVMTKMYRLTGDRMYLDKLYENFLWSDSLMYDKEAQLYYRDAKYIYPKVKTVEGGKSFWARGDGWVLAGLAKVLADMPHDYEHRDIFVQRFRELAQGVARCQQAGGYWSRSMLCEADAPGPETSGTAFFAYGLLWGVNNGYLDRDTFLPVIEKAWTYLTQTALQPDGSIGYVQPIGEKPDPTKNVDARSQAPFGTGAWLLAACEMARFQNGSTNGANGPHFFVTVENPTTWNRNDVVEIDAQTVFKQLAIEGGRQFVVLDADNDEVPYQLTHDGKVLIQAFVRPESKAVFTFRKGIPSVFPNITNGRVYTDRMDDLAWENDRNGWRAYGPASQRANQHVYGFDIFNKNMPSPVVDALYNGELTSYGIQDRMRKAGRGNETDSLHRTLTYHRDHGYGMDAYTVGATLGAGAPALMDGDRFIYPWCWKECRILDNGPLRFTAQLTYPAMKVGTDTAVVETRVITLDKGMHLNRVQVSYANLTAPRRLAAGVVVHKSAPEAYALDEAAGFVAYADAMDHPEAQNGEVYIGCLFPEALQAVRYLPLEKEAAGGIGHVVGLTEYQPGSTFTYYFGSAWSKYDVPTLDDWQSSLKRYGRNVKQPLQVTVGPMILTTK